MYLNNILSYLTYRDLMVIYTYTQQLKNKQKPKYLLNI